MVEPLDTALPCSHLVSVHPSINLPALAALGLPSWLEWLRRPNVAVALSVALLVVGVGCILGLPYVIARIPADYFTRKPNLERAGTASWLKRIVRNLVGWVLLLLGMAMLVLPGQGLLTILIAVVLIDFPGKRRFERWLLLRPRVLDVLNGIRRRAGRDPFEVDGSRQPT